MGIFRGEAKRPAFDQRGTMGDIAPVSRVSQFQSIRSNTMASNRISRINEELQRELSALIRSLKDPRVQ